MFATCVGSAAKSGMLLSRTELSGMAPQMCISACITTASVKMVEDSSAFKQKPKLARSQNRAASETYSRHLVTNLQFDCLFTVLGAKSLVCISGLRLVLIATHNRLHLPLDFHQLLCVPKNNLEQGLLQPRKVVLLQHAKQKFPRYIVMAHDKACLQKELQIWCSVPDCCCGSNRQHNVMLDAEPFRVATMAMVLLYTSEKNRLAMQQNAFDFEQSYQIQIFLVNNLYIPDVGLIFAPQV